MNFKVTAKNKLNAGAEYGISVSKVIYTIELANVSWQEAKRGH